jgi:glutaminyl-peptide cyclotransferase
MNKRLLGGVPLALGLLAGNPAHAASCDYTAKVVHAYPHDKTAFTEGLFWQDGFLYESTGLEGRSFIRKVKLETGEVVQSHTVPSQYFGEGIVAWKDRLIELTWQSHIGFVYDLKTLTPFASFPYSGEGWALTHDDKRLIMSDGTSDLRFLDPDSLKEIGRVKVTDRGEPVVNINELEYVKSEVFANIWHTNRIARIDAANGHVTGWIELKGLMKPAEISDPVEGVLNGIAYDRQRDRLFVTGKLWPKLFEIRLVAPTIKACRRSGSARG